MDTSFNEKAVTAAPAAQERDTDKGALEPISNTSIDHVIVKDGSRVHPQPTTDPLDPLNWTAMRKHALLAIVMFKYFMFTYITTTTVPSFAGLQDQYDITYSQVNWTVAVPALGLAVGQLIWSSFADIYGRRVIFMTGSVVSFAATIGAAKALSYGGYMAARFFQGLGVSPAATVGLAVINDIFFEHERGQKIGLWVLAIDTGLLVGPIIGGFVNLVGTEWIQWLTAILFAVLLMLELSLMPETLYPRSRMLSIAPMVSPEDEPRIDLEKVARRRSEASVVDLKRTKTLSFINVKPVPGMRHPKPWDSLLRCALLFRFSAVPIAVLTFCFTWYWWVLSVITMLPAAYPTYAPQIQGLLFIGLLLGTLFSEVFAGGRLSDYMVSKLARKTDGVRVPEMRLWLIYPAGTLSAVGLIVWGVSVDRAYHWIVGQVAFFLFAAGIQIGNTVICSYIVDSYPLQSMSVVTFYSVSLNLAAFINPFFIASWQASSGWTWCFVAQALIVLCGAMPTFALLHRFGHLLRQKSGQPSWLNPEFDTL